MPEASAIFAPDLLAGRVALVTGGGPNLRKAAAAALAAGGAGVVVAGRRADVVDAAAGEIGDRCAAIAGDIRDRASADAIVAETMERFGRLDVLVNNAGGQYFVPAEGITAKGWGAVQRLNVGGTMTMTRAAVDGGLGRSGGGMVVNVTVSPHHGMPAMAHTGVARAAVEALTRDLAEEWRSAGISVVAAAIGRFDTESLRKYPEVVWRGASRSVPLQRLGTMQEFAWLVALLASPLGHAFNGSVVTLDGAADNFYGPWPPGALADEEGVVPTEERRQA